MGVQTDFIFIGNLDNLILPTPSPKALLKEDTKADNFLVIRKYREQTSSGMFAFTSDASEEYFLIENKVTQERKWLKFHPVWDGEINFSKEVLETRAEQFFDADPTFSPCQ